MPDPYAYRHILALLGFDGLDQQIVARATSLARLSGARLSLLHVIEPEAALDGGYPVGNAATRAAALKQATRRLRYLAASAGLEQAKCHAVYGPRGQMLRQEMAELRPDLVVMGRPGPCPAGAYDILTLAAARQRGGRLLPALRAWLLPRATA